MTLACLRDWQCLTHFFTESRARKTDLLKRFIRLNLNSKFQARTANFRYSDLLILELAFKTLESRVRVEILEF